jgi:hypothetical protein
MCGNKGYRVIHGWCGASSAHHPGQTASLAHAGFSSIWGLSESTSSAALRNVCVHSKSI